MMKKYSALTKYINLLENDNVGEWNCDKENDGSAERPMHLPFVIYSITVHKLADDIYKFAKESDEIVPSNYAEILQANGIKWGYDSMIQYEKEPCFAGLFNYPNIFSTVFIDLNKLGRICLS